MVGTHSIPVSSQSGNGGRGSVRTPSGASVPAMQAWTRFAHEASAARAAGDDAGVARALATTLVSATGASASMVAWRVCGAGAEVGVEPSPRRAPEPGELASEPRVADSCESVRAARGARK